MTRFELIVILRNQVADRRVVRRSLAVEAVLEEWAIAVGADVATWAMAGLGANIDAELLAGTRSGERRGHVAEELLLTEGASAEVAAAARQRLGEDVSTMPVLAAAVAAAEAFADDVRAAVEAGDALDGLEAFALVHRLHRAAEKRADAIALRTLELLARVGLDATRAATLALAGIVRVREDLRW